MICVEAVKKSMTTKEMVRAWLEMNVPEEHFDSMFKVITENYDAEEFRQELLTEEWKKYNG